MPCGPILIKHLWVESTASHFHWDGTDFRQRNKNITFINLQNYYPLQECPSTDNDRTIVQWYSRRYGNCVKMSWNYFFTNTSIPSYSACGQIQLMSTGFGFCTATMIQNLTTSLWSQNFRKQPTVTAPAVVQQETVSAHKWELLGLSL